MNEKFGDLMLNEEQIHHISDRLEEAITLGFRPIGENRRFVEDVYLIESSICLYLGERLVSESSIRFGSPTLYYELDLSAVNDVFQLRGDIKFWEYSGSFRFNLTTGSFMLFLKGGYGWSLYRLKNVSTNGVLLPEPDGPWSHVLDWKSPSTLLPNTWHVGTGIERMPARSLGYSSLCGTDIGLRGEILFYRHSLGIGFDTTYRTPSGISLGSTSAAPLTIMRPVLSLGVTLSF